MKASEKSYIFENTQKVKGSYEQRSLVKYGEAPPTLN